MPGTKASGRPGGNPDFGTKYALKTEREEPLTESLSLRVPKSLLSELKSRENWQELVRQAIVEKLQEIRSAKANPQASNNSSFQL